MEREKIREDVMAFAIDLHKNKWRSDEKKVIEEEYSLEPEEAEVIAEILKELEAND